MSDDLFDGPGDSGQGPDLSAMLRRLWSAVWRQKWWVAIPALIALVPACIYPFTLSDTYSAVASIEVTSRPQIMDMGADFMPGDVVRSRRQPLSQFEAIAVSAEVLGRVLGSAPVEVPPSAPPEPTWLDRALERLGFPREEPKALSAEQLQRARITRLRRRLAVYEEDTLLKIEAVGGDAEEVAALANAVSDSLVWHSKQRRDAAAAEAMGVFNTQVYEYRERIDRLKQEISELLVRTGIRPDLAEEGAERALLDRDLEVTKRQLRDVRLQITALRDRIERTSDSASEARMIAEQRERYVQALQELARARLQYTANAPPVQRLEQLVATLEDELGTLAEAAPPPTPAELETYRQLQAQERSLAASFAALDRERQQGTFDPDKADAMIEYQRLVRELEIDERQLRELLDRLNKLRVEANIGYATFRVLDRAIAPVGPSGPDRQKWLLAGIVLALGVGVGVGLLRELLDQTIRDPDEATQILNVTVLGMVPRVVDGTPPERQSEGPPSSLAAESYRNLRTALLMTGGGQKQSALAITSATAGEGKTTISCNLASSFAQAGRRIVLVDADMRLPRVHKVMGMHPSPGLAELIRGEVKIDEALRQPSDGRFEVITAGNVPFNPSELLASPDFALLLARLKSMYDLVLIDCPVLLGVSDACIVGAQVDGTLLVHRQGSVEKRALHEIRHQLTRARVHLVGLAFNQVDRNDRHFYPAYLESPYVSKGKSVRLRKQKPSSYAGHPIRRHRAP